MATAAGFPRLAKLETIGTTVRGVPIQAVKVTANARTVPDGRRSAVLHFGGQRARMDHPGDDPAAPAVHGYDPDISAELYVTNGDTNLHAQARYGTIAFAPEMSTCETASASVPDDPWLPEVDHAGRGGREPPGTRRTGGEGESFRTGPVRTEQPCDIRDVPRRRSAWRASDVRCFSSACFATASALRASSSGMVSLS